MGRRVQYIDFEDGISNLDLLFVHPTLLRMLAFVSEFAYKRGLPFKLTSIIRTEAQERKLGASSRTHKEGRAFDFSIKGWSQHTMLELELLMEHEFYHDAAISAGTRKPCPVKFHNSGHGPHGHVQCRR